MGVVLPGEADAPVHLDVEVGAEIGRLERQHGRHGGAVGALVVALFGRPRRVPHVRRGQLARDEHVGAVVLDRLEHRDGPAELKANFGVVGGLLRALRGQADGLGGDDQTGQVDQVPRPSRDDVCRRVLERDPGRPAGWIEVVRPLDRDAR